MQGIWLTGVASVTKPIREIKAEPVSVFFVFGFVIESYFSEDASHQTTRLGTYAHTLFLRPSWHAPYKNNPNLEIA